MIVWQNCSACQGEGGGRLTLAAQAPHALLLLFFFILCRNVRHVRTCVCAHAHSAASAPRTPTPANIIPHYQRASAPCQGGKLLNKAPYRARLRARCSTRDRARPTWCACTA